MCRRFPRFENLKEVLEVYKEDIAVIKARLAEAGEEVSVKIVSDGV